MQKGILLLLILFLGSCELNKRDQNANSNEKRMSDQSSKKNIMLTEKEFNGLLEEKGIPPVYVYDSNELQRQMNFTNKVAVKEAFIQGVESLFLESQSCQGCDGFYTMITSQPESFQLNTSATKEEIKKAILKEMQNDTALKICLLPAYIEQNSPDGIKLFPSENGESVNDFWIWYIKCNFFPGPVWMLVKRDGTITAYHYGVL